MAMRDGGPVRSVMPANTNITGAGGVRCMTQVGPPLEDEWRTVMRFLGPTRNPHPRGRDSRGHDPIAGMCATAWSWLNRKLVTHPGARVPCHWMARRDAGRQP